MLTTASCSLVVNSDTAARTSKHVWYVNLTLHILKGLDLMLVTLLILMLVIMTISKLVFAYMLLVLVIIMMLVLACATEQSQSVAWVRHL